MLFKIYLRTEKDMFMKQGYITKKNDKSKDKIIACAKKYS